MRSNDNNSARKSYSICKFNVQIIQQINELKHPTNSAMPMRTFILESFSINYYYPHQIPDSGLDKAIMDNNNDGFPSRICGLFE